MKKLKKEDNFKIRIDDGFCCYLCGAPITDKKDQYKMYGEKLCKICCDEQTDTMLRMSGHEY